MATPMILELGRRDPAARVVLLTWPSYGTDQIFHAPVLQPGEEIPMAADGPVSGLFLLDPATPFPQKALFFLRLRRSRLHQALILFDACPAFVWWGLTLAGCQTISGHSMESLGVPMGWARDVLDKAVPVNREAHETDIHLDLLDAVLPDPRPRPRRYETHVAAAPSEILNKFGLKPQGYVVVQVSASNALIPSPKIWPQDRWAEVIRELLHQGETVVLPGDRNEKPIIDALVEKYGLQKARNISGLTSVREISTVIKHAKFVLCHDSGLMHIGNAHGTPLIALYGPTDWNFTMPKAPSSRILRKNLPCQPCMAKMAKDEMQALQDCPYHIQCMLDISVADVLQAVEQVAKDGRKTDKKPSLHGSTS